MKSDYIELLKKTLINYSNINKFEYHSLDIVRPNWKTFFLFPIHWILKKRNFAIVKVKKVDQHERMNGYDWPANAMTMIGMNRLNNIEYCINEIIENKIEGDLIETGVWRGGATILMRALLKEHRNTDKIVWLADSFEGLPKPKPSKYPADKGTSLHKLLILTCSIEEVKSNFQLFGLLDEQVRFIKGWFENTLPNTSISELSLLRLDGDLYESTFLALVHLYPKLSSGGFVIIDDYNAFPFCRQAVEDYRNKMNIIDAIIEIDKEAIFWQKS